MASLTPVRERVVQFGPGRSLVGILASAEAPAASLPYVILINSGVIHRVGSARVYVELARAFAAAGAPTLRFDLSGVGDSARRADVMSVRESVERDVADAIAYLTSSHGASHVVLMGLCSGAFDAFSAAVSEPRVAGALMVDLPGPFRGLAHTTRHIGARLFRLSSWRNPVRSFLGHSKSLVADATRSANGDARYVIGARAAATRASMEAQMDKMLQRGTRLHFLFTAGLEQNYNHASQFRSTFPRAAQHPAVTTDFFPEPDHSFGTQAMRARLIRSAVDWLLTLRADSKRLRIARSAGH